MTTSEMDHDLVCRARGGDRPGHGTARRRRLKFLDFMNRMVKPYQSNEIHVVLDNLSTHKPNLDRWLARHPNVHFHHTPTHASWLNQIEIWFSTLSAKSLKGGSFRSVPQHVNCAIRMKRIAAPV
jgi:transposase